MCFCLLGYGVMATLLVVIIALKFRRSTFLETYFSLSQVPSFDSILSSYPSLLFSLPKWLLLWQKRYVRGKQPTNFLILIPEKYINDSKHQAEVTNCILIAVNVLRLLGLFNNIAIRCD